MPIPTIVVHGGAGTISDELRDAAREGVRAAALAGRDVLAKGGGCEDAVMAAVRILEDDPTFNAGRGSCMTADGGFEMDAAIMRSRDMRVGAVASVPDCRDPIAVARAVMEKTRHCLLAGPGAVDFARLHGVGTFGREHVLTEKAEQRWLAARGSSAPRIDQADTVGAVALDHEGHLCAAGSTGGVLLKLRGRVGDTPLVGGGLYAAPRLGAACATGVGEAILTHVTSYEVLKRIERGEDPEDAAKALCDAVARQWDATCGLILITADGRVGIAHASRHMSWAKASLDGTVHAAIVADQGLAPGER